jgi:hypothetical protein
MRSKYLIALLVVSAVILLPGAIARLAGASIDVLAPLAAIQMFTTLAYFLTTPASLIMGVIAAVKKEWKKMGMMIGGVCLPLLTWCMAALINGPGWEAVMGI